MKGRENFWAEDTPKIKRDSGLQRCPSHHFSPLLHTHLATAITAAWIPTLHPLTRNHVRRAPKACAAAACASWMTPGMQNENKMKCWRQRPVWLLPVLHGFAWDVRGKLPPFFRACTCSCTFTTFTNTMRTELAAQRDQRLPKGFGSFQEFVSVSTLSCVPSPGLLLPAGN